VANVHIGSDSLQQVGFHDLAIAAFPAIMVCLDEWAIAPSSHL
jgi:hypothetical protein